jgi:hypothetical protein
VADPIDGGKLDQAGWSISKSFELIRLIPNDPALGNAFFPVAIPVGRAPARKAENFIWEETSFYLNEKYRVDVTTRNAADDSGNIGTRIWDGRHSYSMNASAGPKGAQATRYEGLARTAALGDDYYRDMIGIPIESISLATRNMSGDQPELPFRLSEVLSNEAYDRLAEETVDGMRCIVLERPGIDKLWLAIEFENMIVKREWRWAPNGPIKRVVRCGGPVQVSTGSYLPTRVEMDIYGHPESRPGKIVGKLKCKATKIESPILRFEDFARLADGTTVLDIATGTNHTAGQEGSSLGNVFRTESHRSDLWKPKDRRWMFILAVTGLAVVPGIAIIAFRKRNSA